MAGYVMSDLTRHSHLNTQKTALWSYTKGTRFVTMCLGHETDHSVTLRVEVENAWGYRSPSPYIFLACFWQLSFYTTSCQSDRHISTERHGQHCKTCCSLDRTQLYSSVCGLCTEIRNTGETLMCSDQTDSSTRTDSSLKMTGYLTLVLVSS